MVFIGRNGLAGLLYTEPDAAQEIDVQSSPRSSAPKHLILDLKNFYSQGKSIEPRLKYVDATRATEFHKEKYHPESPARLNFVRTK